MLGPGGDNPFEKIYRVTPDLIIMPEKVLIEKYGAKNDLDFDQGAMARVMAEGNRRAMEILDSKVAQIIVAQR